MAHYLRLQNVLHKSRYGHFRKCVQQLHRHFNAFDRPNVLNISLMLPYQP